MIPKPPVKPAWNNELGIRSGLEPEHLQFRIFLILSISMVPLCIILFERSLKMKINVQVSRVAYQTLEAMLM